MERASCNAAAAAPVRRQPAGIEKIGAYPGALRLDFARLESARGAAPDTTWDTVRGRARSVNPPWEDPVTMAVNAARPILTSSDLRDIELVIAGTESSPDQGKPISTFICRHLGVQPHCRNFEVKHACYGGTSAMMMAAHWVASGVAPGKKALVVCTDESRMNLNAVWETVMGAGAVALLISSDPQVLELELESCGYYSQEIGDTFRPTSRAEAGNTHDSLYSYLEELAGAVRHFAEKNPHRHFDRDYAAHVYHLPFSGMAERAHRTACRSHPRGMNPAETYQRKVAPSSRYAAEIGGSYTASTFYGLLSLFDHAEHLAAGDRITVYSYGSGSCAELYSGMVGPRSRDAAQQAGLRQSLRERRELTVEEYEAVERARDAAIDCADWEPDIDLLGDFYQQRYAGQRRLVSRGCRGYFREYEWS